MGQAHILKKWSGKIKHRQYGWMIDSSKMYAVKLQKMFSKKGGYSFFFEIIIKKLFQERLS